MKIFAQDPILQEYAVMEAFEILAGKRKDFTSLHVDQVLSLQKKENGRYINLPESLRVIRQYGGVCLKNNSASDRENAASTEKKYWQVSEKCLWSFRYLGFWKVLSEFLSRKFL